MQSGLLEAKSQDRIKGQFQHKEKCVKVEQQVVEDLDQHDKGWGKWEIPQAIKALASYETTQLEKEKNEYLSVQGEQPQTP